MYKGGLGVTPEARCLISAPLYHSAPCSYALIVAQLGGWLRLEPKFDAEGTLAAIEKQRITTPTWFQPCMSGFFACRRMRERSMT